jgi:hypothetical protein
MNDEELVLLAPVSGVIYPLERVPDPVFSQKLVGDGISIDPIDNILRAPCSGEIVQRHAAGRRLLKGKAPPSLGRTRSKCMQSGSPPCATSFWRSALTIFEM